MQCDRMWIWFPDDHAKPEFSRFPASNTGLALAKLSPYYSMAEFESAPELKTNQTNQTPENFGTNYQTQTNLRTCTLWSVQNEESSASSKCGTWAKTAEFTTETSREILEQLPALPPLYCRALLPVQPPIAPPIEALTVLAGVLWAEFGSECAFPPRPDETLGVPKLRPPPCPAFSWASIFLSDDNEYRPDRIASNFGCESKSNSWSSFCSWAGSAMLLRGVLGGGKWIGFDAVSNSFSFGSDCEFLATFRAGNRTVELSFDMLRELGASVKQVGLLCLFPY